ETEVHLQRVRVAPDTAGHHHPADAQALARRRQLLRLALAVEDFAGGIEQVDIRAQRVLKPGVALALNQQILPREQWQQQIVQEGDQILLFQVIAGG
ncbi:sulfur carrier protein ThiS, partial [Salmonella enterica subsp. enterica serovar Heidelberg str. SARA36]